MRQIDLKTIAYHIDMLADLGFDIKSLDIETGTFTAVMPTYQSGELTSYEREECAKGKIHGIKAVRETRRMGLAEAKAFVEKHYNFPPPSNF